MKVNTLIITVDDHLYKNMKIWNSDWQCWKYVIMIGNVVLIKIEEKYILKKWIISVDMLQIIKSQRMINC